MAHDEATAITDEELEQLDRIEEKADRLEDLIRQLVGQDSTA